MSRSLLFCRAALMVLSALLLTGCALPVVDKWVDRDSKAGTGVYQWKTGTRYSGAVVGDTFQGPGTLTYGSSLVKYYKDGSDMPGPSVLEKSTLTGEFARDRIRGDRPVKFVSPGYGDTMGFSYEGGWNGGTAGNGVVTFKDGRRFEGKFDSVVTPYPAMVFLNDVEHRTYWRDNTTIGSFFAGYGRMTWPDGSSFEGSVYKYFLFRRGGYGSMDCATPRFAGKGVLKQPGRADYEGFVVEPAYDKPRRPVRASEADFNAYVDEVEECPDKMRAAQSGDNDWNRKNAAEFAQARRNASAMLQRDLAQMSANNARTMADMEAASRGSTVAQDRARVERDARFYAGIEAQKNDPDSDYNKQKRENERKAEQRRREEADRNAQRTETTRKRESDRQASTQADEAASKERDRARNEEERAEKEKARIQEQARKAKIAQDAADREAAARERAAKEKAEKERAEREAAKKAEADKARRDKADYLQKVAAGTRLKAIACYGETSVVGAMKAIKPQVVACVDVHYRAQCVNSSVHTDGVAETFVGMGTGCFGDTYKIDPKPACTADQVRVTVREVRPCKE